MASLYDTLQTYLHQQGSATRLIPRCHSDFRTLWGAAQQPALIAHPQTAKDVQHLVRFSAENRIEFIVRTGNDYVLHPTEECSFICIDLREIDFIHVEDDRKTVKVGGGILFRGFTEALAQENLGFYE